MAGRLSINWITKSLQLVLGLSHLLQPTSHLCILLLRPNSFQLYSLDSIPNVVTQRIKLNDP